MHASLLNHYYNYASLLLYWLLLSHCKSLTPRRDHGPGGEAGPPSTASQRPAEQLHLPSRGARRRLGKMSSVIALRQFIRIRQLHSQAKERRHALGGGALLAGLVGALPVRALASLAGLAPAVDAVGAEPAVLTNAAAAAFLAPAALLPVRAQPLTAAILAAAPLPAVLAHAAAAAILARVAPPVVLTDAAPTTLLAGATAAAVLADARSVALFAPCALPAVRADLTSAAIFAFVTPSAVVADARTATLAAPMLDAAVRTALDRAPLRLWSDLSAIRVRRRLHGQQHSSSGLLLRLHRAG